MKLAASLLSCALLVAAASAAVAAKKEAAKKESEAPASNKPALVGSFGDWRVYNSGAGKAKICYLLAEPKSRAPSGSEKAYAFISERPAEHVRNEISFVMGFELATAADLKDLSKGKKARKPAGDPPAPTVTIGDADFDLAPKGNALWVRNPNDEAKIIDEMRKGSSLTIKATAKRGRDTVDTYSLTGFSQAVDKALKDCPGR